MPFTNYPYGVTSFGSPMIPSMYGKPVGFGGKGKNTQAGQTVGAGPGSQVFFVNSAVLTATDSSPNGSDPLHPFKTINFAVTKCVANNGDVIYVGPGHVETVSAAAGLTIGTAGITIIGIGNDFTDRPQIQYTTSTAATVTITAASTWIQGINFHNSIDARVDGIIISANDCRMIDCDFFDDTGTSSLISIRTTSAANRLRAVDVRCYFSENSGTARTEFIRIVGGNDHEMIFCYNDVAATFSTAVFNNVTTAFTGMIMADCYWANGHSTAVAAAFVSTSTGLMIDRTDFLGQGVSSVTLPNAGGFSIDGDSVLTTPAHQTTPVQGSTIAFQKSVVSSTLLTTGTAVITCTGGSIAVENIVAETDATGLATGTNLNPTINNANGISAVLTAGQLTVANLGANATQVFSALTGFKQFFIWESGKVLTLTSTGANCTGNGKLFLTVIGRVLSGAPILS